MTRILADVLASYAKIIERNEPGALRDLFKADLFALLTVGCRRADMRNQWVLDRTDEVNMARNGFLDLWAREHYKTSVISFGMTLQDVLRDPEITVGIFSHTRPMSKGILRQLKREMESNAWLIELFPDVLWQHPRKEAPKWSEDDGLIVKRKGNPKEATIEAWGLVDGQPIGKHFGLMLYDDVVTAENAANPEMRDKTLRALELSYNLGTRGGLQRFVGTRYHYGDAYKVIIERGTAKPRVYPAANAKGEPVLLTQEELDAKRRDMGPYTFSAQLMLDPKQGGTVGFKREWWRTWTGEVHGNTYIIVDPANSKRKGSDNTAIWAVTASADRNWYVKTLCRDKLGLTQRIAKLMDLHRELRPKGVGYEQYGMQADIEALKAEQDRQGYRFEVVPLGGKLAKFDRIMQLEPLFAEGRIWFPQRCTSINHEGELVDMLGEFRDHEYLAWPYSAHDDGLDALARVCDPELGVMWPRAAAGTGRINYPRMANVA